MNKEERWVPVDEDGERWTPRTHEEALEAMRQYPVGFRYLTGDRAAGIVRIEREWRFVSKWMPGGEET